MATPEHEAIVDLFRREPALAAELLRLRGLDVPTYDHAQAVASDIGLTVSAHRADVLLLFTHQGRVVLALIVEIQRKPDAAKGIVWPLYWANAAMQHRCPAMVLVYPTTPETARWAREGVAISSLSGRPCHPDNRPIVLDPADIPPLTREEATASPYLAAFSAMAHANDVGGLDLVKRALDAAEQLPPELSVMLRDTLFAALNDAIRRVLIQEPDMQDYVLKSEIMRRWHAEATAAGRADGQATAWRQSLLETLRARALLVDPASAQRVADTSDPDLLHRWFQRALTASTVDEVFAD